MSRRERVWRDPGLRHIRIAMGIVYALMVIQGFKFFFSFGAIAAMAAFGDAGF